jgi:hypothetical protein
MKPTVYMLSMIYSEFESCVKTLQYKDYEIDIVNFNYNAKDDVLKITLNHSKYYSDGFPRLFEYEITSKLVKFDKYCIYTGTLTISHIDEPGSSINNIKFENTTASSLLYDILVDVMESK